MKMSIWWKRQVDMRIPTVCALNLFLSISLTHKIFGAVTVRHLLVSQHLTLHKRVWGNCEKHISVTIMLGLQASIEGIVKFPSIERYQAKQASVQF